MQARNLNQKKWILSSRTIFPPTTPASVWKPTASRCYSQREKESLPLMSKAEVAEAIIAHIAELWSNHAGSGYLGYSCNYTALKP